MTPMIDSHTIGPASHLITEMKSSEHKAAAAKPTANTGHVFIVSSTICSPNCSK
jgi:hypothetical protein